ncbi:MAG: DNA topoisomerase VI subunit B, partial [Candidatus Methanomethylophilaceae archaeon]|nr:DNA topoisomerase VI subunit B [Candidatus Methanomethylophilaceae archaeon]
LALRLCARNLKSHLNKDERRKKTRAKFEIVQEILPLIAQKSADYLKKPVPDLDSTISKIMNVIWVEPEVVKEKGKTRRTITYTVYNYTRQERSLRLHAQLPLEAVNQIDIAQDPHFVEINDEGKAAWEIDNLQPSKHTTIKFVLAGEMAETFSESDVYISGINPVIVMGADALPGDWGIKGMDIVEYDTDVIEDDDDDSEEVENLDDE